MKARVVNQRKELRHLKKKTSVGKGKARRGSRFDDGAYSASDSESGDEFSFGVARSATALSAGD